MLLWSAPISNQRTKPIKIGGEDGNGNAPSHPPDLHRANQPGIPKGNVRFDPLVLSVLGLDDGTPRPQQQLHHVRSVLAICDGLVPTNDSIASMRGPRIEKGFGAALAARVWPTVEPAPSIRFYQRDVRRSVGPALVCSGLSRPTEFEVISFEPHKDEFLLFYGLVGTGRSLVVRALTGVTRPSRSAITLAVKTMTPNPSLSTSMIALAISVRMGLARSVGAWSRSTAYRVLS